MYNIKLAIFKYREIVGTIAFMALLILMNFILWHMLKNLLNFDEQLIAVILMIFMGFTGMKLFHRGSLDLFDDVRYFNLLINGLIFEFDKINIKAKVIEVKEYYVLSKEDKKKILEKFNISKKELEEFKYSSKSVQVIYENEQYILPYSMIK
jgi:DNA-directed RNA polymerase subunit H (RpoH/RPB5)